jgi:cell division protein FtsN
MPSFERGAYEPSDDVRVFDGAVDDEHDEEGSRLPLLIVIGLLVFAMFAGVVWLAYTQGVAKGRSDAPRMIVADTGPVKIAPSNPGGTQTPYTGLKIYQSPAPADDPNDEESSTPAPTPAGSSAQSAAAPATSPSLAPVIRPSAPPADATPKTAATAAPAPTKLAQNAPPKPAPATTTTASSDDSAAPTENRVATKPPAKLTATTAPPPPKPIVAKAPVVAAPAPVETQSPKPTAIAEGGAYLLQIGAYKSEAEATGAWHAYQAKHPLVGGYDSDIKKVDLGDKGIWYRLRVGSFADKASATALCGKLKADGGDCLLAK